MALEWIAPARVLLSGGRKRMLSHSETVNLKVLYPREKMELKVHRGLKTEETLATVCEGREVAVVRCCGVAAGDLPIASWD